MASLLDEVLGQSGWDTTPLLQPPDERPPSLQPDPRVDALGQTYQDITDYMAQQHQKGVDEGYWTGGGLLEGGHPTLKAFNSAADEYAQGLLLGTTSSGGKYLKAYHGSPHKFDAFDDKAIGTGEGAQAYGYGHYLAENEGIAQSYRKKLSGPRSDYTIAPEFKAALNAEDYLGFDTPGQAVAAMRAHPDWAKRWDVQNPGALKAGLEAHDAAKYDGQGHMYEVQVNADPEKFLHWDKPLSEQHPDVQKFFRDQGFSDLRMRNPGSTAYGALSLDKNMKMTKAADVSAAMREAGIPGIRYLDAGSRQLPHQIAQSKQAIVEKQNQIAEIQADIDRNPNNMSPAFYSRRRAEIADHQKTIDRINEQMNEGTHNAVVFDPATMEIIRRYGLAGLMLGGGGLLSPDKQEQ
jgi:hypothetical protein